jgi:hypothetical protein
MPHGITFQKMSFFIITAVKISNLTRRALVAATVNAVVLQYAGKLSSSFRTGSLSCSVKHHRIS